MGTESTRTLPWVSVEWLNQANFPFFLSGKPAGVFPFTDKMVKYQEQDINREHVAKDSQKKKKQGTQLTYRQSPLVFIVRNKNAHKKPQYDWKVNYSTKEAVSIRQCLLHIIPWRQEDLKNTKLLNWACKDTKRSNPILCSFFLWSISTSTTRLVYVGWT